MPSAAVMLYAPIFMGFIFNILLYGVTFVQMYSYYTTYKKDPLWLKIFVSALFLCDTLQTMFDAAYVFDRLLTQYGNIETLAESSWQFVTHTTAFAIMATMVQLFFSWRIKTLTGSWILVIVIAVCSLAQFAGGIGTAIGISFLEEISEYKLHNVQITASIWLVSAAVTDVIIAVALVYLLRKQRTGFAGTDDVIKRIIRLTVQTGTATAVFAFVDVVCYLTTTGSLHIFFCFVAPKLYANSLMMSLNARESYARTLANGGRAVNGPYNSSSGSSGLTKSSSSDGNSGMRQIVVNIDVEKGGSVDAVDEI